MTKTYVVAVDGSEHGWKALDLAADLARVSGAKLIVAHVVRLDPLPEEIKEFARLEGIPVEELVARHREMALIADRVVEEGVSRARAKGLEDVEGKVLEGDVVDEILRLTRESGAELLFVGSRGLSELKGLLLGSVSHKLLQLAPCTVVAVR